jgi:hypothetical protein
MKLTHTQLREIIREDLRKWFGTGKTGSVDGGGWDRYNLKGEKIGKCGDAEEGEPYAACLSKEKADKLGPKGRASFVRRKREAQKKAGDAKKGGEQTKGQKPTLVKTKANEMKINLVEKQLKGLDGIPSNVSLEKISKVDKLKIIKTPGNIIDFFVPDWAKSRYKFWQVIGTGKIKKNISGKFYLAGKGINKSSPTFETTDDLIDGVDWKSVEQTRRFNESIKPKLEEKLTLFLEKNTPTDSGKWSYAVSQAKQKFDVYPSAYANAWAAKKYKELGGGWKKEESLVKEDNPCWDGYEQIGMKMKDGKEVPNCVPINELINESKAELELSKMITGLKIKDKELESVIRTLVFSNTPRVIEQVMLKYMPEFN